MGKVCTGAKAVVIEPAWKRYSEKTWDLFQIIKNDKEYKDPEWDNDTGALKATSVHRKKPNEGEMTCVSYPKGEDTKGCTDLSCGFEETIGNTTYIHYPGKLLELRCQDVLYKKGCVCVLLPDTEKDPNTGNTKSCVDCRFMMDGMDKPVLADIKSVSLNSVERDKIMASHVGNIISHAERQAKKNDTENMILYYDNADYFDEDEVKNGLKCYAGKGDVQIRNVIIVVNDNQPVKIISVKDLPLGD